LTFTQSAGEQVHLFAELTQHSGPLS
jgi:hypothetical protein